MIAFWSGADNRSQGLHYSLDRGRTWKPYEKNPYMVLPERDPKVFWYEPGKHWVMFLYGDGKYHVLTSKNLLEWKDEKKPISQSYECPDFFELALDGDPNKKKWVLVQADGKYSLGSFNGTEFKAETDRIVADINEPVFYATQSWANTETGDGRRIQTVWMRHSSFPGMPFSQQISFPCELTLHSTPAGPRIFRQPVKEIEKLHAGETRVERRSLAKDEKLDLAREGELFHIKADVEIPEGSRLVFDLRGVPLILSAMAIQVGDTHGTAIGKVQSVEILLDRASLEAFVNEGEISSTNNCFPAREGISVKAEGGPAVLKSVAIHELKSMWKP
jgi:levanase/fructan beta-fructosidase